MHYLYPCSEISNFVKAYCLYKISIMVPSQSKDVVVICLILSYKHTFCIYADAFKAGLRLPLHPLIPEILHEFGVSPTQIHPHPWRVLICFISFFLLSKNNSYSSPKDHFGEGWWFSRAQIEFKLLEGLFNLHQGMEE